MAVTETGHLASREIDDLYRAHVAEVYRYTLAVLGNHADAEDVTQTTFLNAYRALEQGVKPRNPSNWLLAISQSVDDRLGRKEKRRLRDHLSECPDCASFARLQQRHRSALRGLTL